jgi:IS5 family transposase
MALIEPHQPKSARMGRPPIGVQRMLRMYFLQQWYSLSDEGLEDATYDSYAKREFVGIDLAREQVPDATTLLKFRRLLEQHELTEAIFDSVNEHLGENGLLMRERTMVDATIIAAPSSTKNSEGERDPEMHQVMKGNEWHFCMKAHMGADVSAAPGAKLVAPAIFQRNAHLQRGIVVASGERGPVPALPTAETVKK